MYIYIIYFIYNSDITGSELAKLNFKKSSQFISEDIYALTLGKLSFSQICVPTNMLAKLSV
jgi:hypothetical protein